VHWVITRGCDTQSQIISVTLWSTCTVTTGKPSVSIGPHEPREIAHLGAM